MTSDNTCTGAARGGCKICMCPNDTEKDERLKKDIKRGKGGYISTAEKDNVKTRIRMRMAKEKKRVESRKGSCNMFKWIKRTEKWRKDNKKRTVKEDKRNTRRIMKLTEKKKLKKRNDMGRENNIEKSRKKKQKISRFIITRKHSNTTQSKKYKKHNTVVPTENAWTKGLRIFAD